MDNQFEDGRREKEEFSLKGMNEPTGQELDQPNSSIITYYMLQVMSGKSSLEGIQKVYAQENEKIS